MGVPLALMLNRLPEFIRLRIEVQRRTAQTEWTDAGSVSIGSTSFSDTGRVSGVTYLYRVRVNGSYADSSWSNEASGTTP